MARKSTIKLLLVNESDNEGERLISLLRNAGRVARAQRADSAEQLHKLLEDDSWDLLIADDKHPEISVAQCLQQLDKLTTKLPVIVLRSNDPLSALSAGASDVIHPDDEQRLIHAAFRELHNLEQSRTLQRLTEKLADAEQRSKLLMSQSQDPVAYIADGMIINCNELFANRFAYDTADELDCAPIIDLIDAADHDKFKSLLKSQAGSDGSSDCNFTGNTHAGGIFSARMELSNAVFDEENCLQLTIKDQGAANTSSDSSASSQLDPTTGLYHYDYFLSQVDSAIKQASSGKYTSCLMHLAIDQFNSIRSRNGIANAHQVQLDIAEFIGRQDTNNNFLAHFCDDAFTLLLDDTHIDAGQQKAEQLRAALEDHIIELNGQSFQCTASIGLVNINGKIEMTASDAIDYAFNASEQLHTNGGTGNGVETYVQVRERKALGDAGNDGELDNFLAEAIADGSFALQFQPVVSLRGSSGEHYEVSTTMANAAGEALSADEFLGTIQFSSFNTRLDRWIILEATKKLAALLENNQDTRLFINLTANTLQDESLITWLGVALKAGDITPESLIFQFTEQDIIDFLKPAIQFVDAVKAIGCKVSVTDFGQIDDPIKNLTQVKADYAIIAQSFTNDLKTNDTQALKALVSSINENQAQAIISGVENAAALAQLWQIGVDFIQGGYMARPTTDMNYEFTDIA